MSSVQNLYDHFLHVHHQRAHSPEPPPPPLPSPPPSRYPRFLEIMLFDDGDASLLKKWIVKRLEDISDADSDVLADYVLALLRHEQAEEEVKRLCVEQLEDFLQEHTKGFVDDVFDALRTKAFLSVNSTLTGGGLSVHLPEAPTPSHDRNNNDHPDRFEQHDRRDRSDRHDRYDRHSHHDDRGRKRSYYDDHRDDDSYDSRSKHPRRSTRPPPTNGRSFQPSSSAQPPVIPPPWVPPGAAPAPVMTPAMAADPGMAALFAAQMAAAQWFPPPEGKKEVVKKVGQRCKDYDEKGFCMKGDMCPYEHGVDHIVVPGESKDEYDPTNSSIVLPPRSDERGTRGGSRGGKGGRRGGRSEFSTTGPSRDRTNTKLVVEQIPAEKLSKEEVEAFFSEFGSIQEVELHPEKALAIVTFGDHAAAKRAYDSPKPVFENRFVKVFWHRTDHSSAGAPQDTQKSHLPRKSEDPPLDIEKITKQQEELQKAYEEKMAKKKAVEAAAAALKEQSEKLLKAQAEEKAKLMAKLAARSKKAPTSGQSDAELKKQQTTLALQAQLSALEAEAARLGVPAEPEQPHPSSYRGRGRARGFTPRGRGFPPTRGYPTYRGRGRGTAPATMKLDNRTKRVIVHAASWEGGKEEEFRHYLLNEGIEVEAISDAEEEEGMRGIGLRGKRVTFKDRSNAERFVYGGNEVVGLGSVVMRWDNGAQKHQPHSSMPKSEDENMTDAPNSTRANSAGVQGTGGNGGEEEYDTAEIDERWQDTDI